MSKSTKGLRKAGIASVAVTLTLGAGVIGAGAANAVEDFSFDRINGDDRYHTSALVAHEFGDYTEAILANGEPGNYADALAASYLAGVKKAPVLLTKKDTTPDTVIAELEDQGVKNLTVVGGETVISAEQVDALEADGYTVTRVAGDDRFATNREIIEDGGAADVKTALVATGFNYADALAGGPAAYKGSPLALSSKDDIDDETVDALKAAGVTNVVILGGTSAVAASVENELKEDFTVERVAGDGRSETSTAFADYAKDKLGFVDNAVNIATGFTESYGADALSGAPLTGSQNRPLLITRDVNNVDHLEGWLEDNANTLEECIIFGGNAAVSVAAQNDMEKAAQSTTPPASNQDFAVTPQESVALTLADEASADATSDDRVYTVNDAVAGEEHQVVLVKANQVTVDADGNVTFADANDNNEADLTQADADITVINGVPNAPADATASITPEGNSFTFRVDGASDETIVPVVFFDADEDGDLDLNADGTPVEAELVGVGGSINYQPEEADQGPIAANSKVTEADKGNNQVVAGGALYNYDANDAYYINKNNDNVADANEQVTLAKFEAELSVGDELDGVSYQTNPDFQSVFLLEDITPEAPNAPTASNTDDTSTVLTVTGLSDDVDTVTIYGNSDGTADNVTTSNKKFATATADADANTTGFQVNVTGLTASTSYEFAATQTVDEEESNISPDVDVTTLAEGATAAFESLEATNIVDGTLQGEVSSGDEIQIGFSQPVNALNAGDTIRVVDAGGESYDLVFADDFTATYNTTTETFGGEQFGPNEIVTLTITTPPAVVDRDGNATNNNNAVDYPVTITTQSGVTEDEDSDPGTENAGDTQWTPADDPDNVVELGGVAAEDDVSPLATDADTSVADGQVFGDTLNETISVDYDEVVEEGAGTSSVAVDFDGDGTADVTYTDGQDGITIAAAGNTVTVTTDGNTAATGTIALGTSQVTGTGNIQDPSGNADGGFPEVIDAA